MDENSILEQVKIRLRLFSIDERSGEIIYNDSEDPVLKQLVRQAIKDCYIRRGYPAYYTAEMVDEDQERYTNIAVELVIYDYTKEGAEYESSHNENGTYRSFEDRRSVLRRIIPLTRVVS